MERLADLYDKLTRRHKIILLLLGCAFSMYLSFIDNVDAAVTQYDGAVAERDALASQLAGISQVSQDRASAELALKKADEDLGELFQQLPKEPDMEALLGTVAEAARSSGIELVNYKVEGAASTAVDVSKAGGSNPAGGVPGMPLPAGQAGQPGIPPVATAGATPLPPNVEDLVQLYVSQNLIKVDVAGTYPGITTFLDRVLSLPRIVRVGDLEISAPAFDAVAPGKPPKLSASIRFQTYSQKPEPASQAARPAPTPAPVQPQGPQPVVPPSAQPPQHLSRSSGGPL